MSQVCFPNSSPSIPSSWVRKLNLRSGHSFCLRFPSRKIKGPIGLPVSLQRAGSVGTPAGQGTQSSGHRETEPCTGLARDPGASCWSQHSTLHGTGGHYAQSSTHSSIYTAERQLRPPDRLGEPESPKTVGHGGPDKQKPDLGVAGSGAGPVRVCRRHVHREGGKQEPLKQPKKQAKEKVRKIR